MTNSIIGIDVSKAKIDVAWLKDPVGLKIKSKVFDNNPTGFTVLMDWVNHNIAQPVNNIHCVMEATGIYHEPLAFWLHDQGFNVTIENPAHIKNFARSLGVVHKTDKKDSFVLARYGSVVKPAYWIPEAKNIRELKALLARLDALEEDSIREKNRLEKTEFSAETPLVTESIRSMIQHLEEEKARLNKEIDDHINRHPDLKKDQQLLLSIPAVGIVTSRLMLTVIRGKQFENAGQCAAFLGLILKQQESGVFRGRTTLSKKGNPLIRAKLYMAAIVAGTYNPCIKAQKERLLKNGKTKMQALGAAMRKLVHICFGVLKNQTKYSQQAAL